ncbi:CapA family protein [Kribbella sandramycini]|uniref:CapA family protein n=1 Tax=Kribbella sandramycini TaxID=60450 RepID=A0A7Y4L6Q0_9ACTN|nr:CapA family protein [Kribbella sandramycini]MBB6570083.1 poly-gamma-glutamate synthesis protein (capsule biosynthesis protein) [Kribbella sandramycini]NOL45415.1 CapA family protein [Kribbella sandramycini]
MRRLLIVLVLLAASACTAGGLQPDPPVDAEGPELTIAFGGDVNFHNQTQRLLDDDPATAFGDAAPELANADVAIVNLETAITGRGTAAQKRFLFRTDTRAVAAVKAAGVDAVSLANNHTLDYGQRGLTDTLAITKRLGLPTFGAGLNSTQAFAPWRTTIRGIRIAVIGVNQVEELATEWAAGPRRPGLAIAIDHRQAVDAVRRARRTSDLVIVVPHWGSEFDRCPTPQQRALSADLSAAGADLILGAHAHVLQGMGYLGRTYVAYNLGNLLFGGELPVPETWRGGVLRLTLRARTVVSRTFVPTEMDAETRRPRALSAPERDQERARLNNLRTCAALTPTPAE